jgi:hypothetical protein
MLSGIGATYRRHRFAALFLSLLLTIAGQGALEAFAPGFTLLELLLAVNLIAAVATAGHDRAIRILIVLGTAFVVTRAIAAALGIYGLLPLSQALWVVTSLLATVATVRHALQADVMNAERIFAALDAYLLVGLMFGVSYWTLDQVSPAAFGAPGASASTLTLDGAIYFSFVTISTLGYGDIVPLSAAARGLAILEAVSGQMYLAVLVAWLVSLFARDRNA